MLLYLGYVALRMWDLYKKCYMKNGKMHRYLHFPDYYLEHLLPAWWLAGSCMKTTPHSRHLIFTGVWVLTYTISE